MEELEASLDVYDSKRSFTEIQCIRKATLLEIQRRGWDSPTYVQFSALSQLTLNPGCNLIVQGPSSSGKTTCLILYALGSLDLTNRSPQVCIIVPNEFAVHLLVNTIRGLSTALNIAIHSTSSDSSIGIEKAQIVVGLPQDIAKVVDQGLAGVHTLLLDDADLLLDIRECPGAQDIVSIRTKVGVDVQRLAFSTVMPKRKRKSALLFAPGSQKVIIPTRLLIHKSVCLYAIESALDYRADVIAFLYHAMVTIGQTVVFCTNSSEAEALYDELQALEVTRMHILDPDSHDSQHVMDLLESFYRGEFNILLVTEESILRGFTFPFVKVIVHYGVPLVSRDYLFRGSGPRKPDVEAYISRVGLACSFNRTPILSLGLLYNRYDKRDTDIIAARLERPITYLRQLTKNPTTNKAEKEKLEPLLAVLGTLAG